MRVIENETINLDIVENETISLDIVEVGYPVYPETYKGSYTITPNKNNQVLKTGGLMASKDITVNAIPNCYGLVEWNGSFLKIS